MLQRLGISTRRTLTTMNLPLPLSFLEREPAGWDRDPARGPFHRVRMPLGADLGRSNFFAFGIEGGNARTPSRGS